MSLIISSPSNSISSPNFLSNHRPLARIRNPFRPLKISTSKHGRFYLANQGSMQSSIIRREVRRCELYAVMGDNLLPGPPTTDFFIWATCVLGSIISLILTLWKIKGGFLLNLENEVERVEEGLEHAVEIVEEVADATERLSSGVADNASVDDIVKKIASWVEKVSKEVRDDARLTLDFIHKFDEIKGQVVKYLAPLLEFDSNEGQLAEPDSPDRTEEGQETQGEKEKKEKETSEGIKNTKNKRKGRKENDAKEDQGSEENEVQTRKA